MLVYLVAGGLTWGRLGGYLMGRWGTRSEGPAVDRRADDGRGGRLGLNGGPAGVGGWARSAVR